MGQKFLAYTGASSKLGRTIRQVHQRRTPKSRTPREDLEKKPGSVELERSKIQPEPDFITGTAGGAQPNPITRAGSHTREHRKAQERERSLRPRRPQSPKARAATMKNLKKARAALKQSKRAPKRRTPPE